MRFMSSGAICLLWETKSLISCREEIKAVLDSYVIGQEDAKKTLSVAVYNHYKRINNQKDSDVEIQKSTIYHQSDDSGGIEILFPQMVAHTSRGTDNDSGMNAFHCPVFFHASTESHLFCWRWRGKGPLYIKKEKPEML